MLRISAVLFCLIAAGQAWAGNGPETTISSNLRSVTVYRRGAELVHSASANLGQGASEVIIGDISSSVDLSSLRVSGGGSVTILSVAYSTEFLKPAVSSPAVRRLQDSAGTVRKEMGRLEVLVATDESVLDVLKANQRIAGNNGLTVLELTKMVEYYKVKTNEVHMEISGYKEKIAKLKAVADRLEDQINEEQQKGAKTSGRLTLLVESPAAGAVNFTVSYITMAAAWTPYYDLRVDNVKDPLRILYKAKLTQTTGLDWKKVKLALSTSQPGVGANAPVLSAWFLQYVDLIQRQPVASPLNALQGRVPGLQVQESSALPVVAGFSTKEKARVTGQALDDLVTVNDNQMDVTFDIDVPYDIPANGKEHGVVLKEYKVPAYYRYYSAPRVDKEAYLLGAITGWEKLSLLPGEANIIVEGANIGKSYIDVAAMSDTLNLTLGRDKRVVVKKEKLSSFSSVKFLGGSKREERTYELTVRNNKSEKIEFMLKDQYPISTSKDVEVEVTETSGAIVNKETGILTWGLELAPGETKKIRVSYTVKYPKDKVVNL